MKTIYLLHGEQAVRIYHDNGIKSVIASKEGEVSEIIKKKNESLQAFAGSILAACDGWMANAIITDKEYKLFIKSQK